MKVANISIRVRYQSLDETDFRNLRRRLESSSSDLARQIFGRGYEFDYDLEDGSLWQRVKILGFLLMIMNAIETIDDFPGKVADLAQKVETFYHEVRDEFLKTTESTSGDVLYTYASAPDVTRLQRIAQNTNQLIEGDSRKDSLEIVQAQIVQDIARLYRSDRDDIAVQMLLNHLQSPKLPWLPKSPNEAIEWVDERRPRELPWQRTTLKSPEAHRTRTRRPRNKYHNRIVL